MLLIHDSSLSSQGTLSGRKPATSWINAFPDLVGAGHGSWTRVDIAIIFQDCELLQRRTLFTIMGILLSTSHLPHDYLFSF